MVSSMLTSTVSLRPDVNINNKTNRRCYRRAVFEEVKKIYRHPEINNMGIDISVKVKKRSLCVVHYIRRRMREENKSNCSTELSLDENMRQYREKL